MIRLIIVVVSAVFFICISHICDYKFPLTDEHSNESWDKLKHILYLCSIGLTWLMFYFKPDKYEKYVRLAVSVFVFGIIVPSIIDKRNRYEPQNWHDFALIILAIYIGSKYIFPKLHNWYKICLTKK